MTNLTVRDKVRLRKLLEQSFCAMEHWRLSPTYDPRVIHDEEGEQDDMDFEVHSGDWRDSPRYIIRVEKLCSPEEVPQILDSRPKDPFYRPLPDWLTMLGERWASAFMHLERFVPYSYSEIPQRHFDWSEDNFKSLHMLDPQGFQLTFYMNVTA